MPKTRRGFTLVELLVVVAILAMLISILMPTLSRAREITRRTICQTNLKTMGTAWTLYFNKWNNMMPQTHNVNRETPDSSSQFTYLIFCGREHTTGPPDYVNAGVLYKEEFLDNGKVYVCPTIERNYGKSWFTPGHRKRSGADEINRSPWPVIDLFGTYMTYMRRRINNYDDPGLSYFHWSHPKPRPDHDLLFWSAGVGVVNNPGSFSFMADRFETPGWALLSHVPGVNVQYLDGHVRYWEDPTWDAATGTGEVLYDNGIDGWGGSYNWKVDDVWMIIDGYHSPPVGQGK